MKLPRGDAPRGAILLAILLGILAASLLGCEGRDRTNPFDPLNPHTEGHPAVLNAVAGDSRVELRWSLDDVDAPVQVRALRDTRGKSDELFTDAGRGSGYFLDTGVENGTTFSYVLELLTPGGDWLRSAPELATPGPAEPWVGDAQGRGVGRLSPDGRDLLFRVQDVYEVLDIQIYPDGTPWMADWGTGRVLHLDHDGRILASWVLPGANALAIDQVSADIWVGSFTLQQVSLYSRDGRIAWSDSTVGAVEDLEPGRFPQGGVWVASRSAGVTRIYGQRVQNLWPDFDWPVSLTRDSSGGVWVIDRGSRRVSRIDGDTGEVAPSTAELIDPRDGTIDGAGGLWVADPGRGGLCHLDASGDETGFLAIGAVSAVTLDPEDGRLWAVFRDEGRVSVYDTAGEEQVRTQIGGRPVKVEGSWD